jgi:hypothetical protein
MATDRDALASFLTGAVGPGPESPPGFLPSGFAPGQNLAAQAITLLLNLVLDALLPAETPPIDGAYFLNVDPVTDLVDGLPGPTYDPILTTGGVLGSCADAAPADGVCDAGTVVLSPLGTLALALDEAGTTVEELLDAAIALVLSGASTVDLHGVTLTAEDVAELLGLVNESYDEGVPTGFVTAYYVD